MTSNQRCLNCHGQDLFEEYQGSELTCASCGFVGFVEKIPDVYDLVESIVNINLTNTLHEEMIRFAEELNMNRDISEIIGNLKIVNQKPPSRRKKC
jgi:transcription initiation factor TFIIIB Brf1 subunit/transcription initiation factor TFIIB